MIFANPILWAACTLPAMLFMLWAQHRVRTAMARWSRVTANSNITGAEAAAHVLRSQGVTDVSIGRVGGWLSDHYDPRRKALNLSPEVHDGRSLAALGVAAHEAGHAVQHATAYPALALRTGLVPAAALSNLAPWMFVLGLWFHMRPLMDFAIIFFACATLFTLITLPVEFNASSRAVAILDSTGLVSERELPAVRAVLGAAALTYVAAAVASLSQLLYYVLLRGQFGDD